MLRKNFIISRTEPKSQALPNGNGDVFDQRDADMSPPPKKPSPGLMMPLPGMATRVRTTCLNSEKRDLL